MNRLSPAVLLLAVLSGACQPDCFDSRGGGSGIVAATPPLIPLDGTWEGHEAPFDGSRAWWRFELERGEERGELRGTYTTDRFYHMKGELPKDTVRGPVTGSHCGRNVDLDFEVTRPGNFGNVSPVDSCRLSGRERRKERINGLLTCEETARGDLGLSPSHETALYLDRVRPPH